MTTLVTPAATNLSPFGDSSMSLISSPGSEHVRSADHNDFASNTFVSNLVDKINQDEEEQVDIAVDNLTELTLQLKKATRQNSAKQYPYRNKL